MLAAHNDLPCEYMAGRTFCDLDTLVDRGHTFLEEVERNPCALDNTSFLHARLVVHEWLANLVQYADFRGRMPLITICVEIEPSRIRYIVEDNSVGFDFNGRVARQRTTLEVLPNRGMGLLMIAACTEELIYRRLSPDRHRLEFTVPAGHDPQLHIPLRADC